LADVIPIPSKPVIPIPSGARNPHPPGERPPASSWRLNGKTQIAEIALIGAENN